MALVDVVKVELDRMSRLDGYNVGFNSGGAAGQTVMDLHVQVIPRRVGDMDDPSGGVRHVIPEKGNYLAPAPVTPGDDETDFLEKVLGLLDTRERRHSASMRRSIEPAGPQARSLSSMISGHGIGPSWRARQRSLSSCISRCH